MNASTAAPRLPTPAPMVNVGRFIALLRIFAGDRLDSIMKTFGVAEGEAITHPWLNRAIETAQKRVEQRNYDIRKNLLKYDDVVNDQRKAVFEQRQEFMDSEDLSELVGDFRREVRRFLLDALADGDAGEADHLDPRVVLELDTFWCAVGGTDPAELLGRLGSRWDGP